MSGPRQIQTLMVVDDSAFDQMLNKRIFDRSNAVQTLIQFTAPVKALEHLVEQKTPAPDVIILDINMPCMDGFEFLERAASEVGSDLCPVIIMLTTSLDPNDKARALSFDLVSDFLCKPLTEETLEELEHRVSKAA